MSAAPPLEAAPTASDKRRNLRASYATGVFAMGQAELLTMVIPLWAVLQGASPTEIGTLIGARSLLTFFLAIHGGALLDRLGTRRVMMFFAFATGGLAAIYPMMPWFPAMVALQMLIGFAGNMAWIGAQTIIAQVTGGDPGEIGRFSFFSRIGNVVAPLMMGAMWDIAGPTLSFLFVTVWSAMLFVAVAQISNPQTIVSTGSFHWRDILPKLSDYTGSLKLIVIPAVTLTLAISFLRHATNGVENSFFIVYMREIGFAGIMIGALFSIAEIINGFGSLLSGRAARILPLPWLMVGFTSFAIAMLISTPFLGGAYVLLAGAHSLRRFCEGLVQPLMFSLQARAVDQNQQGSIVGLRVTNNRLSSIITPVVMGIIVDHFGLEHGFLVIGGILLTACMVLAIVVAASPALRNQGRS